MQEKPILNDMTEKFMEKSGVRRWSLHYSRNLQRVVANELSRKLCKNNFKATLYKNDQSMLIQLATFLQNYKFSIFNRF